MAQSEHDDLHLSSPPQHAPVDHDSTGNSLLQHPPSDNGEDERYPNQTILEEKEMRQKLMDMESSFLPEPSTIQIPSADPNGGADDTYLLGVSPGNNEEGLSRDMDHTWRCDRAG